MQIKATPMGRQRCHKPEHAQLLIEQAQLQRA